MDGIRRVSLVIGAVLVMALAGLALRVVLYPQPLKPLAAPVSNAPMLSPVASAATTPVPTIAGVPKCTSAQLHLALGMQNGAAGTLLTPLVWTNTSHETCSVGGYPAVVLIDPNGKQVGEPATPDTSKPVAAVDVKPGQTAHVTVATHDPGNYPAGTCTGLSLHVRTTLPGDTATEQATFEETYCGTWLVSPFTSGSSD